MCCRQVVPLRDIKRADADDNPRTEATRDLRLLPARPCDALRPLRRRNEASRDAAADAYAASTEAVAYAGF